LFNRFLSLDVVQMSLYPFSPYVIELRDNSQAIPRRNRAACQSRGKSKSFREGGYPIPKRELLEMKNAAHGGAIH
jgi:hypothetical protein